MAGYIGCSLNQGEFGRAMAAEALSAIRQLPPAHLAVGPLDLLTHDMPEQIELSAPAHLMPGVRLQHYKGGLYRVEGACLIEATRETGILYRPEQGNATHLLAWSIAAFLAHSKERRCKRELFLSRCLGKTVPKMQQGGFAAAKMHRTSAFVRQKGSRLG